MTDTQTETQAPRAPERPHFRAWLVQDDKEGNPVWQELTGLWPTKSGTGYRGAIRKPVTATTGRLVILPAAITPNKGGRS